MKTRILTTALMITFTTVVIAESHHSKSEDSIYSPHLSLVFGSNTSETVENNSFSEFLPSGMTIENTSNLAEWVESMNAWEQGSNEISEVAAMEAADLSGWYESRESWEQESAAFIQAGVEYNANLLDEWFSDRETWEQEVAASDLAGKFRGSFQQEWISNMETWEQK